MWKRSQEAQSRLPERRVGSEQIGLEWPQERTAGLGKGTPSRTGEREGSVRTLKFEDTMALDASGFGILSVRSWFLSKSELFELPFERRS